jgi:hypothetical protein
MYLWLNNTGEGDAYNVSAGLSTDDPLITISEPDDYFGFIPAGEYRKCQDGFVLTISEECPEKEISFNLAIHSDEGDWTGQITFSVVTGIKKDLTGEHRLVVYPNPTNHLIYLESNHSIETPLKIELWDNNGRCLLVKVLDQVTAGDAIPLDLSNFGSGLYILSVGDSETRMYQKIIKLQ